MRPVDMTGIGRNPEARHGEVASQGTTMFQMELCAASVLFSRAVRVLRFVEAIAGTSKQSRTSGLAAFLVAFALMEWPCELLAGTPPNPCPIEASECTQAQALTAAEAALATYQIELPQVGAYIVHIEAQPGSEFARYCVRWTNPSGCYYQTIYRARTFVQKPANPCGNWVARVNCTKGMSLAIAKQAELYYQQHQPNVGAYIMDYAPTEPMHCVRWTSPSGCYFTVYYMDGVDEKSNSCDACDGPDE